MREHRHTVTQVSDKAITLGDLRAFLAEVEGAPDDIIPTLFERNGQERMLAAQWIEES